MTGSGDGTGWADRVEVFATPLTAYKLARLDMIDGRVKLAPLHRRASGPATYENPGRATCDEGHAHDVPQRACTCGFHAVTDRDELWRLGWHSLETVTLTVSLYGRIVAHQHGYRAAGQQATLAELSGRCWWCGHDATLLGRRRRNQPYLAPSCARCARHDRVGLRQASQDIGCPLRFDPVLDERAPDRVQRHSTLIQSVPAALVAVVAVAAAALSGAGPVAGIGALLSGGWLIPGRFLAERITEQAGLSPVESRRVVTRGGGWALACALGGWAAAGLTAVFYTPMH